MLAANLLVGGKFGALGFGNRDWVVPVLGAALVAEVEEEVDPMDMFIRLLDGRIIRLPSAPPLDRLEVDGPELLLLMVMLTAADGPLVLRLELCGTAMPMLVLTGPEVPDMLLLFPCLIDEPPCP